MKLAQGTAAVKRAKGRLHHVFRVLLAAKTAGHLPLDQPAEPGTILLVQLGCCQIRVGLQTRNEA